MTTDAPVRRPEDAQAMCDALRLVRDGLTGHATRVQFGDAVNHLSSMCAALSALAAEGFLEAARLHGRDGAAVIADLEQRMGDVLLAVAGGPG